jgi:hypothetical protein
MFAVAAFSARLLWATLEALLLRVIGGPFPVPVARIRRQTVSRMGVFVFCLGRNFVHCYPGGRRLTGPGACPRRPRVAGTPTRS